MKKIVVFIVLIATVCVTSLNVFAVNTKEGYYYFPPLITYGDVGYDVVIDYDGLDFIIAGSDQPTGTNDRYSRIRITITYSARDYVGRMYYYNYTRQEYIEVNNSVDGWLGSYGLIYVYGTVSVQASVDFLNDNAKYYAQLPSDPDYFIAYNDGYIDGYDVGSSQTFGDNMLGETLAAPFNALNSFVLYESTNGFQVTLGGVVGAVIALTLFLAFLKIFAGG